VQPRPHALPNAGNPATAEPSPATGPRVRSKISGNTLLPRRFRALRDRAGGRHAPRCVPAPPPDPTTR
jgi:hypothetical protein